MYFDTFRLYHRCDFDEQLVKRFDLLKTCVRGWRTTFIYHFGERLFDEVRENGI